MYFRKQPLVTNGDWCVGTTTDYRKGTMTLGVFKIHDRPGQPSLFQRGDVDGLEFPISDEGHKAADDLCLERGYLVPFGRNSCEYVGSRAFRRRKGRPFQPDHWKFRPGRVTRPN